MTQWRLLALIAAGGLFIGFCLGWWVCSRFSDAEKVERLQARIDFMIERIASMDALATEYEERKETRKETVVKYVENPIYRECKPDPDWVQEFNRALAQPSTR
jgi:sensor domain CHASE-containing protein